MAVSQLIKPTGPLCGILPRHTPERRSARGWLSRVAQDALGHCRLDRESGRMPAARRWLELAGHMRRAARERP